MENENAVQSAENKQSTSRQLVAVVFVLSLASKMFLQPIALLHAVGRDAYVAMAIDGAIDLATLGFMLAAIRLSGENDFFSMLVSLIGKVGAKIAASVIGLYLFFKLTITTGETLIFYSDSLFAEFDIAVMLVILLLFLWTVACHTLKALSRLTELLTPIVVVGIAALATIVIATRFDAANILPFMNTKNFGDAVYKHMAFSGDFTPLVFFVGRTKTKKHTSLFSSLSGVVGTCVAVFFAIVMSAAFGNVPMLADTGTNLSTILQYSIGNVYGRIDLFSTALWSIAVFLETALFFFATCKCFRFVAGEKGRGIVALAVGFALYLVEVFAMTDPTIRDTVTTSAVTSMISLAFTIAIPLFAFVVSLVFKHKCGRGEKDAFGKDNGECKTSGVKNEN